MASCGVGRQSPLFAGCKREHHRSPRRLRRGCSGQPIVRRQRHRQPQHREHARGRHRRRRRGAAPAGLGTRVEVGGDLPRQLQLGQPLSTSKPVVAADSSGQVEIVERIVHQPVRQKMPRTGEAERSSSGSPTARDLRRSESTTTASPARSSSRCRSRAPRWQG